MDKHVVNLEIAKELKEAGWKNPTWFHYDCDIKNALVIKQDKPRYSIDGINCPLATEILEELPVGIKGNAFIQDLTIRKDVEGYYNINYGSKILITEKDLPNALAKMWLYLKKEKINV